MNLSGPLLLLLLTAVCTVSGENLHASLLNFGNMIRCAQPGVDPLRYNGYGNYCGYGGGGTAVDALDECCKAHDECYGAYMRDPPCQSVFIKPYVIHYWHTCSEGQPTCSASNSYCQAAACECDQEAALCFARTEYNPRHKA